MRRLLFISLLWLVACEPVPVSDIEWKDGDSGIIDGVEFRLHNYDAPETGPVGERPGNAKCELERHRGRAAREFVRAFTRSGEVVITRQYGTDRYGRIEVYLAVGNLDVGTYVAAAGHYQSWKHLNGRALEPRPDWCKS